MPDSSILGGTKPQPRATGRDTDALGPSDSSDSGSDVQGEAPMATGPDQPDELGAIPVNTESDSDRSGTGERGSATGGGAVEGADILPDRLADADGREAPRQEGTNDALGEADDLAASDANGVPDEAADDASDDGALESLGKAIIAPVAGAAEAQEPPGDKPPPAPGG